MSDMISKFTTLPPGAELTDLTVTKAEVEAEVEAEAEERGLVPYRFVTEVVLDQVTGHTRVSVMWEGTAR